MISSSRLAASSARIRATCCVITFGLCLTGSLWSQNTYPWPASGNVGIGTTNPFAKLEVNSGSATPSMLNIYSTPSTYSSQMTVGILALGSNGGGNNIPAANITGISENSGDSSEGTLSFSTRRSGAITEAMRLTSGGNVGIGTMAPGGNLDVQQNHNSYTNLNVTNTSNGALAQSFVALLSDGSSQLQFSNYGSGNTCTWKRHGRRDIRRSQSYFRNQWQCC